MQGGSASGKSFVAEALCCHYIESGHDSVICSTDDFWYLDNPNIYGFDFKKLGEAHQWNKDNVRNHMSDGVASIIVDNTNTTKKEAQPYIDMAKEFGYEVRVVSVGCDVELALACNADRTEDRQIPADVISKQRARIEPLL